MRVVHNNSLQSITEIYEYTYDHVGRKTSFVHTKDGVSQKVAKYNYDAIGRMTQKVFKPAGSAIGSKQSGQWTDTNTWLTSSLPTINDLVTINNNHSITIPSNATAAAGSLIMGTNANLILQSIGQLNMGNASTSNLQSLDYKYHIRGGLLGINLDANNDLTNSLFSFRLDYETGSDGFFDGNIRRQYWKSSLDGKQRAYEYSYDGASRIKSANYASQVVGENYALNSVNYDRNGNITTLSRNGLKSNNTFGLIDNLAYAYNANSNKILKVDDISNEIASFKDVTGNDYTYWEDGSLKSDNNKGISLIEYNYLKLPKRIVKGSTTILYQYDASGRKLRETIGTDIIDFIANKVYKNGYIYQLGHDEGRIVNDEYEYFIYDHLGNLRVAFLDSIAIATVSQKQDFDPYGSQLNSCNYLKKDWKQSDFKFGMKKYLEEIKLNDFGWRQQDPVLGRMWNIDNKAEKYYSYSPMQFALNNPLKVIEVNGDTTYRFDNNGVYIGMFDMDVNGIQGAIGTIKNYKDAKGRSFKGWVGDNYFSFNDPAFDKKQLNQLLVGKTAIHFISNENMNWIMSESGIKQLSLVERLDFAFAESMGGRMDFNYNYTLPSQEIIPNGNVKDVDGIGGFMIFQNGKDHTAFNLNDAGQFLWGQAMKLLGFSYTTTQISSNSHALGFEFGFDSKADQSAILQGFLYKNTTKGKSSGIFEGTPFYKFQRDIRR